MTKGQRIFNIISLVWGCMLPFGIIAMAIFAFQMPEQRASYSFIVAFMTPHMLIHVFCSNKNLKSNTFNKIPTILQIISYITTISLIPLGLYGVYLLFKTR